jgi:hypothetical protein
VHLLEKVHGIGTMQFLGQPFSSSRTGHRVRLESAIVVVAALKIVVSMTWFIVIASNLTMGVAWHRFLAFFNIYFKRNIDKPALGALPTNALQRYANQF